MTAWSLEISVDFLLPHYFPNGLFFLMVSQLLGPWAGPTWASLVPTAGIGVERHSRKGLWADGAPRAGLRAAPAPGGDEGRI